MADLAAIDRVNVVEWRETHTVPAGEALTEGAALRVDATSFKAMLGNASAAGEAGILGLNTKAVSTVNMPAVLLKKGLVALYTAAGANVLAGLAPGALVYVSNNDSRLADAAGTVPVIMGKVVVLWNDPTAPTKLLSVDL